MYSKATFVDVAIQLAITRQAFIEKSKISSSISKRESTEALKPRRKVKEANIKASSYNNSNDCEHRLLLVKKYYREFEGRRSLF